MPNTCLSGGAIEIFLDPVLPAPRVVVVGDTPVAEAIRSLGAQLGLDLVQDVEPVPGDLAVVLAAHGREELHVLRRALEAGVPYVGLVASKRRGSGVLEQLRRDGVSEQALALIDVPAGARHRLAHAAGDRAFDPRRGRLGAPRRSPRRGAAAGRPRAAGRARRRSRSTRSAA